MVKSNPETLYINLFTTGRCNNCCPYCIEIDHLKNIDFPYSRFGSIISFIRAQERKYVSFNFYGGEPTLHPYLKDMIKELEDHFEDIKIVLTTNLQKKLRYFKDIRNKVFIEASLHLNETDSWVDWMEKAIDLRSKIDIMVTPETFYDGLDLFNSFKDCEEDIAICPIDDFRRSASYKKVRKKYSFKERAALNHGFKDMICDGGYDIDYYGNVTKCSRNRKILSNIFEYIEKVPIFDICPSEDCPGDVYFNRYNIVDFK